MEPRTHLLHPTVVTPTTTDICSSVSSPQSPPRKQLRHVRRRSKVSQSTIFSGTFLRRCFRYWLMLPLLYISGLFMCACSLSRILCRSPIPGSVYRSHELFQKLWPDIESDNSTPIELSSIWKYKDLNEQKPCPITTIGRKIEPTEHRGYLVVDANGGLNQQRSSICNAVAIAGLLNATLVIPRFEYHNVWKDPSKFDDIYDLDHFVNTLAGLVKVVQELPTILLEQYDYNISNVPTIQVDAWTPVSYYLREVYPVLQNEGIIRIAPFANRLATHIPSQFQFLRCLANYKALRFATSISTLAKKLVKRMMEKSPRPDGKYVSVHLRFEEDMVAFSCCMYDGGKEEQLEMDSIREKGWKGKFKHKDRLINPRLNRINGKCPLTPLEVGMMLRGMGFDNNTAIYLASGELYQAKRHLAPLLQMFPLLQTKQSLATPEELAPHEGYSSRLAALDYMVTLLSEAFVTTQGGNFPHFLMGHRRFLYGGHAKTIKPDKIKLVLLLEDMGISWKIFKDQMKQMLVESNREGTITPRVKKSRRKNSIYKYPFPECRCLQNHQNITLNLTYIHDMVDHDHWLESII
ncbi:O-fucosyltransferase 11 [Ancistrocladus abbreviatus]